MISDEVSISSETKPRAQTAGGISRSLRTGSQLRSCTFRAYPFDGRVYWHQTEQFVGPLLPPFVTDAVDKRFSRGE